MVLAFRLELVCVLMFRITSITLHANLHLSAEKAVFAQHWTFISIVYATAVSHGGGIERVEEHSLIAYTASNLPTAAIAR